MGRKNLRTRSGPPAQFVLASVSNHKKALRESTEEFCKRLGIKRKQASRRQGERLT
jgi:hypothetical protein